jgi:hypothetical protein
MRSRIICAQIRFNFDNPPGKQFATLPPHENFA